MVFIGRLLRTPCLLIVLCLMMFFLAEKQSLASENSRHAAMSCVSLATFHPLDASGKPLDFDQIQDAPTHILKAKIVPAAGDVPEYCDLDGYIQRNVGIEIHMPTTSWNGNFAMVGCGGMCGAIQIVACDTALTKGYSCIFTDMGHQSTGIDAVWAYNNLDAMVDFGYRSTHVSAIAGKALTAAYYGAAPKLSYYMGCSTGGRQGYVEAERFPGDFNGILAGAPPISETGDSVGLLWAVLALTGKDEQPIVSSADLKLINHAALAACDEKDGVKDGVIADPGSCTFDPHILVCKAGTTQGCISAFQADAVAKVYAGPHDSQGRQIYRGFSRGSELGWEGSFLPLNGIASIYAPFILSMNRYLNFLPAPGPTWKFSDFSFDRDPDRMQMNEALFSAANPDFRGFRDHGGRMISFQGWNDAAVQPQATSDFYEAVERQMGGPTATQNFFRLFMAPGVSHCQGGTGAYAIDYLGALEDWVERGKAPDQILAVRPTDPMGGMFPHMFTPAPGVMQNAIYSRPLFPYPSVPVYSGHGDSHLAQSFIAK